MNSSFIVSAAVHNAAGKFLRKECATLGGCSTGDAKITGGYMLPAKCELEGFCKSSMNSLIDIVQIYRLIVIDVIHTVGPTTHCPEQLESCYKRSLEHVMDKGIRSVVNMCVFVVHGITLCNYACV